MPSFHSLLSPIHFIMSCHCFIPCYQQFISSCHAIISFPVISNSFHHVMSSFHSLLSAIHFIMSCHHFIPCYQQFISSCHVIISFPVINNSFLHVMSLSYHSHHHFISSVSILAKSFPQYQH